MAPALPAAATVVHVQPDDVLLIGNIGPIWDEDAVAMVKQIRGTLPAGRGVLLFEHAIDVATLADQLVDDDDALARAVSVFFGDTTLPIRDDAPYWRRKMRAALAALLTPGDQRKAADRG